MVEKLLWLLSFTIVAFGNEFYLPLLSPLASTIGYGIAFYLISQKSSYRTRALCTCLFFFSCYTTWLIWLVSHPYMYIWAVLISLSIVFSTIISVFLAIFTRKHWRSHSTCWIVASIWTLMEYSRIYFLSGWSFHQVGLPLAHMSATLQLASYGGIFLLSFITILINSFATHLLTTKKRSAVILYSASIILLFSIGAYIHNDRKQQLLTHDKTQSPFTSLVFSQAVPPDIFLKDRANDPIQATATAWQAIFMALEPYQQNTYDLILFPEMSVPYPADLAFFSKNFVQKHIKNSELDQENYSSIEIATLLAQKFNSPIAVGLEGIDRNAQSIAFYNSLYYITPLGSLYRYDKQILVPFGEYIPFSLLRGLGELYGVYDSFQKGATFALFPTTNGLHVSPSICYEETFGDVIRKGARNADVLINASDDYWYPGKLLGKVHLAHARLRTVETGRPLLRACSFGLSGAINSIGENVKLFEGSSILKGQEISFSLFRYPTFYLHYGDAPIVIFSSLCLIAFFIFPKIFQYIQNAKLCFWQRKR